MRTRSALILAGLLAVGPAAAQKGPDDDLGPVSVPANADGAAMALKLDSLLAQIQDQVRSLRERAMSGNTDGVEQAQKDLEDLRDKLSVLIPERQAKKPTSAVGRRQREAQATQTLADVRTALTLYSGEHDWQFPKALEDLVPKYLREIPSLDLPDHGKVMSVRNVGQLKKPEDMAGQIKDSGGWLYISDPQSSLFGSVLIDCTHRNQDGDEWDRL